MNTAGDDADREHRRREAEDQLKRYASDCKIPVLVKGTALHRLIVILRGFKLELVEELAG